MIETVGLIVAIACGVAAEIEGHGRNWAGWGVIVGFATLLYVHLA
jgi:hypothetical protein